MGALAEEDESDGHKKGSQLEGEKRLLECEQEDPFNEEDVRGREIIYRQPLRKSEEEEAEAEAEEMTKRKVVSPSQVNHSLAQSLLGCLSCSTM